MHNQCMYLIYDMHGVKAESNQRIREKFHVTCTFNRICRSNDAASNDISVMYCKIQKLF